MLTTLEVSLQVDIGRNFEGCVASTSRKLINMLNFALCLPNNKYRDLPELTKDCCASGGLLSYRLGEKIVQVA